MSNKADKNKADFIKAIFNVKEYTKNLKVVHINNSRKTQQTFRTCLRVYNLKIKFLLT